MRRELIDYPDLVVGPSLLTDKDIQTISTAIAKYRKTGKHPAILDKIPRSKDLKALAVTPSVKKGREGLAI